MPTSSQPVDEYAGLMSPQEKQWLQSIQAMQLSGNQPLQDDYYFVVSFILRERYITDLVITTLPLFFV